MKKEDSEIKIGSYGLICGGEYDGWNVFVEDDAENTGGYLILYTSPPGEIPEKGYDYWVEDYQGLRDFFRPEKRKVKWF